MRLATSARATSAASLFCFVAAHLSCYTGTLVCSANMMERSNNCSVQICPSASAMRCMTIHKQLTYTVTSVGNNMDFYTVRCASVAECESDDDDDGFDRWIDNYSYAKISSTCDQTSNVPPASCPINSGGGPAPPTLEPMPMPSSQTLSRGDIAGISLAVLLLASCFIFVAFR